MQSHRLVTLPQEIFLVVACAGVVVDGVEVMLVVAGVGGEVVVALRF